ncbi:uncharacterized protein LOC135201952 [Macrobrachium nipponense]|uniref:uncharacterized protein LOC135201952 n=1 Tax=Macrobrachium nipponense TaxID=159736 RepID=UPI0030C84B93
MKINTQHLTSGFLAHSDPPGIPQVVLPVPVAYSRTVTEHRTFPETNTYDKLTENPLQNVLREFFRKLLRGRDSRRPTHKRTNGFASGEYKGSGGSAEDRLQPSRERVQTLQSTVTVLLSKWSVWFCYLPWWPWPPPMGSAPSDPYHHHPRTASTGEQTPSPTANTAATMELGLSSRLKSIQVNVPSTGHSVHVMASPLGQLYVLTMATAKTLAPNAAGTPVLSITPANLQGSHTNKICNSCVMLIRHFLSFEVPRLI